MFLLAVDGVSEAFAMKFCVLPLHNMCIDYVMTEGIGIY